MVEAIGPDFERIAEGAADIPNAEVVDSGFHDPVREANFWLGEQQAKLDGELNDLYSLPSTTPQDQQRAAVERIAEIAQAKKELRRDQCPSLSTKEIEYVHVQDQLDEIDRQLTNPNKPQPGHFRLGPDEIRYLEGQQRYWTDQRQILRLELERESKTSP